MVICYLWGVVNPGEYRIIVQHMGFVVWCYVGPAAAPPETNRSVLAGAWAHCLASLAGDYRARHMPLTQPSCCKCLQRVRPARQRAAPHPTSALKTRTCLLTCTYAQCTLRRPALLCSLTNGKDTPTDGKKRKNACSCLCVMREAHKPFLYPEAPLGLQTGSSLGCDE